MSVRRTAVGALSLTLIALTTSGCMTTHWANTRSIEPSPSSDSSRSQLSNISPPGWDSANTSAELEFPSDRTFGIVSFAPDGKSFFAVTCNDAHAGGSEPQLNLMPAVIKSPPIVPLEGATFDLYRTDRDWQVVNYRRGITCTSRTTADADPDPSNGRSYAGPDLSAAAVVADTTYYTDRRSSAGIGKYLVIAPKFEARVSQAGVVSKVSHAEFSRAQACDWFEGKLRAATDQSSPTPPGKACSPSK